MIATITGDIVQSQTVSNPSIWMDPLKKWFQSLGETPTDWQIYRGDSFQLEANSEDALRVAIVIKSIIKKLNHKKLDVRLSIGVGERGYREGYISESSGDAFVYSGTLLDELKQENVHLGIRTPSESINKELNLMFKLALVIMNSWTSKTAEVSELLFSEPGITQTDIADKLGIAQSTVNERIKRGSVHEIIELEQYFRDKLNNEYN
ncbi:winged helix-turn-helix transcriptional regulator [Rhodohalobacter sp. SW132]|uniref:SatD family protein n=1 Tax=Rhodohalobacter sp. SW132 TaxID=2293433 RepID=UPI000E24DF8C|nr:SatD family protein [Rhodohalobacter sp. SW132]REL33288.1 winged helix-turn-helix transcriptional regulator [Rhodohalobacter sp. SW132]